MAAAVAAPPATSTTAPSTAVARVDSAPDGDADRPPEIHLQCEDAINAELNAEEQGERAKAVMQSGPRMPAVAFFGRYGDKWHNDIVCLGHNAVRRQLFDAFVIGNALGKLVIDVGDSDLARVYAWLGTLDSFVRVVFEIEDHFIYPLVDTHVKNARTSDGNPVYLPELLSVRGRREAKSHVLDLLSDARKTRDVATGENIAKVHALRYALDQFGANILDYFSAMEKFAPKLFKKSIKNGEREKLKIERKMFEFVLSQPHGAMLAALLTQCIESRNRRRDFIERNIRKDKLRAQFKTHIKSVEGTHMQLARIFDRVASSYERKFNVRAFVKHYDEANHGKTTLEMFRDVDINYEPVDNEEGEIGGSAAEHADGEHEPRAEQVTAGDGDEHYQGVGLDEDIIEVHADDDGLVDIEHADHIINQTEEDEDAGRSVESKEEEDDEDDDEDYDVIEVQVPISPTSASGSGVAQ